MTPDGEASELHDDPALCGLTLISRAQDGHLYALHDERCLVIDAEGVRPVEGCEGQGEAWAVTGTAAWFRREREAVRVDLATGARATFRFPERAE